MSNQNCSEELKAHILAELETGASVRSLARKYTPSEATIRIWKSQAVEAKFGESESMEDDACSQDSSTGASQCTVGARKCVHKKAAA